jgi:hypothetical protein
MPADWILLLKSPRTFVSIEKFPYTGCVIRGELKFTPLQRSLSGGINVDIVKYPGFELRLKVEPPAGSMTVHLLSNVPLVNSSLKDVGIGVGEGDAVGTGVGDAVGLGVGVGMGLGVGVGDGVGVLVGVGLGVAVGEGVGLGEGLGLGDGVGLGVGVVELILK